MSTVEIKGVSYQIGTLDAMKQFHVSRRIGPILAAMGVSIEELSKNGGNLDEGGMMEVMGPVMTVVSKMDDETVEYIIKTCLEVVSRQEGDRWAKVQVNGRLMYADIGMPEMLQLTVETVKGNLGSFF